MRVRGMPSTHGPRGDGPVLRCRDRGVPRRRVHAVPIPRHAEGAPPPLVRRLGPLGHLLLRPGDRLRLGMVRGLVQAVLLLRDSPRGLPRRGDPRPRPPPPEDRGRGVQGGNRREVLAGRQPGEEPAHGRLHRRVCDRRRGRRRGRPRPGRDRGTGPARGRPHVDAPREHPRRDRVHRRGRVLDRPDAQGVRGPHHPRRGAPRPRRDPRPARGPVGPPLHGLRGDRVPLRGDRDDPAARARAGGD